jgi:hypothetical protein
LEAELTDAEINKIVSKFLRERFKALGFENATAKSEEDYDGSSIIRVKAHFSNGRVPSEKLVDVAHDIRSKLIDLGEERYVFLDSVYQYDEVVDEDDVE